MYSSFIIIIIQPTGELSSAFEPEDFRGQFIHLCECRILCLGKDEEPQAKTTNIIFHPFTETVIRRGRDQTRARGRGELGKFLFSNRK